MSSHIPHRPSLLWQKQKKSIHQKSFDLNNAAKMSAAISWHCGFREKGSLLLPGLSSFTPTTVFLKQLSRYIRMRWWCLLFWESVSRSIFHQFKRLKILCVRISFTFILYVAHNESNTVSAITNDFHIYFLLFSINHYFSVCVSECVCVCVSVSVFVWVLVCECELMCVSVS